MPTPSFIAADPVGQREAILNIHIEYMTWVYGEMERAFGASEHEGVGASVPDYVASMIHKICAERPPKGVFYLLMADGQVAGMGGLRFVRSGLAEIKRLYVRLPYRGMNWGQLVLRRLMSDARSFGYHSVCLDTAPFMKAAHRLYEAHGFVDCEAYEGTEVPLAHHARWRFMQCPVSETHAGGLS